LCALEPALSDALGTLVPTGTSVFVTFTLSRPLEQLADRAQELARKKNAKRYPDDPTRGRMLADLAAQRLRRVATSADLATTSTPAGRVAYGFVDRGALDVLRAAVRCEVRDTVTAMPTAELVSTFWSLLDDASSSAPAGSGLKDPWYIAELICGTPA
jgi:HAMP domain-containing protein